MAKIISGDDGRVILEYPPCRRTIIVNWRDIWNDREEFYIQQESYFIQLPYLFILKDGYGKCYLSFGKEPFNEKVEFYFPALPNVYEENFLVCLGNGDFWKTAYYEFLNYSTIDYPYLNKLEKSFPNIESVDGCTIFRWRGSMLAYQYFDGFAEWQKLNLQEVFDRMTWKPEQCIFSEFRLK